MRIPRFLRSILNPWAGGVFLIAGSAIVWLRLAGGGADATASAGLAQVAFGLAFVVALASRGRPRDGARNADGGSALQGLQDAGTVVVESSARQNYGFTLFEQSSGRMKESVQALVGSLGDFQRRMEQAAAAIGEAEKLAVTVRTDGESGARETAQAAADAGRAADIVSETRGTVDALTNHSRQIGDVVTMISSIARATHILSFNAAIEAARAGESGRGFAVVAAEVQRLATQTQDATSDVRSRIEAIVDTSNRVVESIAALDVVVNASSQRARAASESLARIIAQIGGVSDAAAAIASSASEQTRESVALHDLGERIAASLIEAVEQVSAIKDANDRIFDSSIALKQNLRVIDVRPAHDAYALLPLIELVRSYTAKCIKLGTRAAAEEYRGRCEALDAEVQRSAAALRAAGDGADRAFVEEFLRHYKIYRDYCYDTMEQVAANRIAVALQQIGQRNVPKYVELKGVLMRHVSAQQPDAKSSAGAPARALAPA
ncbi:MAG TPA: methyl-accepting chemotaxis protein [Burkholderiaceae bacterium]|nr:methyl-accepting chemotaxis protein [Burkholderiaceae bacterium]